MMLSNFKSTVHRQHGVPRRLQSGFTLFEMVLVIVIMGVIGAITSVFMKSPIDAYFASAQRAALTDVADITLRRMSRDVHRALPNSIRTSTDQKCFEFIPTKTGARYRTDIDASSLGDILNFNSKDASFNMMRTNSDSLDAQKIEKGDVISVYNLQKPGADAYAGENTSQITQIEVASSSSTETNIGINDFQFPFASDRHRFYVIPKDTKVVAYVCRDDSLYRAVSNSFGSACAVPGSILAKGVNSCQFIYDNSLQSNALLQLSIALTDTAGGESVKLFHQIHVNNTP
jgi:MSHA biogenesis protein MshO